MRHPHAAPSLLRQIALRNGASALIVPPCAAGANPRPTRSEMVHLLGRKRTPPVPSSLHLPLRSKAEFLRALDASSISPALRTVVAELDQLRRAGEPQPANVVGACTCALAANVGSWLCCGCARVGFGF